MCVCIDEIQIIFQDELVQWNRLTEEMLYLLIVIVGAVSYFTCHAWSLRFNMKRSVVTEQHCVSR